MPSTSNNRNATSADFDNVIESTAEETNVSVSTSDTHGLDGTSDRTVREQCFHIEYAYFEYLSIPQCNLFAPINICLPLLYLFIIIIYRINQKKLAWIWTMTAWV